MRTNVKSKTLLALVVALSATAMFGLVGCGGGDGVKSEATEATEAPAPAATTTVEPKAAATEEFSMTEAEIYEAYAGATTDGSATAYYFGDADLTKGGLLFMDASATENVSYMGKIDVGTGTDGTTVIQITDSVTGNTVGFSVEENADGTMTLDLGDDGSIVMAEVTPSDVIDAITAIQESTTNVG